MARNEAQRCRDARVWMRTNYGRSVLAPLTSIDKHAFDALVHVWDVWVRTRDDEVLEAAKILLRCMQPSTRNIAVACVSFSADWAQEIRVRQWLTKNNVHGVSEACFFRRNEVMQ